MLGFESHLMGQVGLNSKFKILLCLAQATCGKAHNCSKYHTFSFCVQRCCCWCCFFFFFFGNGHKLICTFHSHYYYYPIILRKMSMHIIKDTLISNILLPRMHKNFKKIHSLSHFFFFLDELSLMFNLLHDTTKFH